MSPRPVMIQPPSRVVGAGVRPPRWYRNPIVRACRRGFRQGKKVGPYLRCPSSTSAHLLRCGPGWVSDLVCEQALQSSDTVRKTFIRFPCGFFCSVQP